MGDARIAMTVRTLKQRLLPDGGFSERPGSGYRTDATAWAILALAESSGDDAIERSRSRLAASQLTDGRVGISVEHPHAFWTTPLAALAWHGSASYMEHQRRAVRFLLKTSGRHWQKIPDSPVSDDPSLLGWPWIEDTFSWVQPTALAVLALKLAGESTHARVREALKMMMNRQLPHGGWNYGNTIVCGQELYPQPESTGMALAALSGEIEKKDIRQSLRYLQAEAGRCRTPLSLGWALLGLSTWNERPRLARVWIAETLGRQQVYGDYGTTMLSLLLIAYFMEDDIIKFIALRR